MLVAVVAVAGFASEVRAQAVPAACKLAIAGSDAMQYDKKELKAPATCKSIELTLKHSGKLAPNVMGHNWVLAKAADMQPIASAGIKAGIKNNHVPVGDKRVIASTPVVGGGKSATITFSTATLKKGESYMYFCTFPGHSGLMKGKFIFG
jgi:azurin